MQYLVVIRPTGTGYSADVPDLPGCVAAGRTVEKVREEITRAIALHVEMLREMGEAVPEPRPRVELVSEQEADTFYTWVDVSQPVATV